jgi:hypothetical protein
MSEVIECTKDIQHAQSELLAFYYQLITNAIRPSLTVLQKQKQSCSFAFAKYCP